MMPGKPPMPSRGPAPMPSSLMGQSQGDDGRGAKLLALQQLLGSIAELASDDIRPDIEKAQQAMHLQHESAEGDQEGVEDAQSAMQSEGKPGLDVTIGMGGPKSDDESADESDESGHPKGFLAILAKKVAKK